LTRETPVKTHDPERRKGSLNKTFQVLIAFALIERNENDETSSASDHSSRSVDMGQDSLDILRIHGIVQAFFVDILAEEGLAHFWLDRAIRVFCRAFDESDRRIQTDPATGVPEDYRRFSIHGKRMSAFLDRFERRFPGLYEARDMLEARLGGIQIRIDQLNRRNKAFDEGTGETAVVSVFERTNSSSEVDSSTPPSNSSMVELQLCDDSIPTLESPTPFSPTDHNPYHFHVTYPYGMSLPDPEDASRTVTPQPAPTEIFDSISVPDDYTPIAEHANHRTIKRHSERRYRDHAGAWRASPQILSDPRVSLSRETVKGVISPPGTHTGHDGGSESSGSVKLAPTSDAELSLNKITQLSPPPQKSGGHIGFRSRTSSAGSSTGPPPVLRPKLIPGRPSYTGPPQAETAVEDDCPVPTFSNIMGTHPPPSSSYTAATIMRLKESDKTISTDGLPPVKVSSPLTTVPVTVTIPGQVGTLPTAMPSSSEERSSPTRTSRPSSRPGSRPGSRPSSGPPTRSARSSPAQYTGPFRPPPIPFEVNTTSSLQSTPSGAQRMTSYGRLGDGVVFEEDYEPPTQSFPMIRPYPPVSGPPYPISRPDQFAVSIHPAPWTASDPRLEYHPQGYWSQPMSRDPSHQSSVSYKSTRSQPARNRSPLIGSGSSPMSQSNSSPPGSPSVQVMQRPRSRRPSLVETEPSPRLGPAGGFDPEPMTSYQLYHDAAVSAGRNHHNSVNPSHNVRRLRSDSAGGGGGGGGSSVCPGQQIVRHHPDGAIVSPVSPVSQASSATSSRSFFRRFGRRRRSGEGFGHHAINTRGHHQRRAESANGRLFRTNSRRGSPDVGGSGDSFVSRAAGPGVGAGAKGGETMVRGRSSPGSGSGGFKLADGTVLEFGSSAPASSSGSGAVKGAGAGRGGGSGGAGVGLGILH
jgi:hypothetical protein